MVERKRRLTVGGDEGEGGDETDVMTVIPVEEERGVIVAPLGPRADLVPTGPRGVGPWLGDGPRVRGWDVMWREFRYVDWSLVGVRNGIVGDSYRSRGGGARAQLRGNFRGRFVEQVGRGHYPFR